MRVSLRMVSGMAFSEKPLSRLYSTGEVTLAFWCPQVAYLSFLWAGPWGAPIPAGPFLYPAPLSTHILHIYTPFRV